MIKKSKDSVLEIKYVDHALDKKLIKQDDIVALTAVGAGMTSGSCIIKF